MAALAILNPRPRRARKGGTKRRRKMTAKQLKFFGPRKSRKVKAARRKAKPSVIIVEQNPKGKSMARKARRSRRSRKAKVFTHNPRRSRRRSYRRNPRSIEAGFFNNTLVPAAIGAGGAIAADWLLGYVPLPPQYKQGFLGLGLKIASALVVGYAVGMVANREAGEEAAAGGVIVTLYGMSRGFLGHGGGGMARYVPMNGMGRYVPMNGYAWGSLPYDRSGARNGLGYLNPARTVQPMPPLNRATMRFIGSRQ